MLDFTEFKKEFITGCRKELAGMAFSASGGVELEERSIRKAQRGELAGLIFKTPDTVCAPTYYVEDFYDAYKEGKTVRNLSQDAVRNACHYIQHPPVLPDISLGIFEDPSLLRVRLINKSKNRDYLTNVPHIDACGLALIAEIRFGEYRAVITDELLDEMGMSKEDLFETALDNSSAYDRATLFDLSEVFQSATGDCENLLESSTAAPLPASLYVLSNEDSFFGAAALFYPGMLERLTILIGGAFYVLPSSIHEVLVLPVTGGDAQKLADIIKTANRTVTDSDVFLADDLFVCEAGRLRQVSYSGMIPRSGVLPC